MNPSDIFGLSSTLAMIMWALMILLPNWKLTTALMKYKVVPVVLSLVYVVYITTSIMGTGFPDFGSLGSVMQLFTQEEATLAGWVHYLAFDLLIGMWILHKNEEHKIHHLLIIPCLLCTFMLGPAGFLLFMILKTFKKA